jgi:molybdate transport system ATP-binding protein
MTLSVDLTSRAGDFVLDASFETSGRLTVLFGRSGAGKTTLINLMAGLARPDRARIVVDGTVLIDTEARVNLPTHRRRIGYVFQDGRLFPHMSVRGNLYYGHRRTPDSERWADPDEVIDMLGIAHLLDRRPAGLSGGEVQRVAIGRALLASPRLLLMDEPLASLDATRKSEVLPYIEQLRDGMKLPILYVSHTIDEVIRLADALVLIDEGKVVASGGVNDVFSRLDLLHLTGRSEASVVMTARIASHDQSRAVTLLDHAGGTLTVPLLDRLVETPIRLRIRARDVALAVGEPGNISIRNRLKGAVVEIASADGAMVEVKLDVAGAPLLARITRDAVTALGLETGQTVTALIKSAAIDNSTDE